jgi:hypothetical protein
VFHSLQYGHLPIHFGEVAPQELQEYCVFILIILIFIPPQKIHAIYEGIKWITHNYLSPSTTDVSQILFDGNLL